VYGLVHGLPADQVEWDVVTGVSAGALNSAGIGIFPVGDELRMSEFLIDLWGNITTQMVWTEWD
jgi:predicted acylesterase/phospholipase RssA